MYLTPEEEKIFNGDRGPTYQKAIEILIALGDIYDADRLIPIKSAQIAGVSYKTIGDAGLEWISDLKGKVAVHSILNPAGMDRECWKEMGISEDFAEKQTKRDGITTSVFAKGDQIDYPPGIRPQGQLYVLNAANAELAGALTSEKLGGRDVLSGWKLADDRATWKLSVPFPGFYRTELHYSATNMAKGDSILLSVADWKKSHTLRQTASETELVTDELMVLFNKKGTFELHVSPESVDGEFHLHEIRLVPRK